MCPDTCHYGPMATPQHGSPDQNPLTSADLPPELIAPEAGGQTAGDVAPATTERSAVDRSSRTGDSGPVKDNGGVSAGVWVSLIVGALVLVALLVFIIQNNVPATFHYFGWHFQLPLGVAMLIAAIGGLLIAGIAGSVRIFLLSRRLRKANKRLTEIDRMTGSF